MFWTTKDVTGYEMPRQPCRLYTSWLDTLYQVETQIIKSTKSRLTDVHTA